MGADNPFTAAELVSCAELGAVRLGIWLRAGASAGEGIGRRAGTTTHAPPLCAEHRAALGAGADPVLVTSWVKETQAKRAAAEARLKRPAGGRRRMTREEITDLVTALGDVIQVLKDADPADKAEVYSRLGLTLTYHPQDKRVKAETRPDSIMYVGACPRGELNRSPIYSTPPLTHDWICPDPAVVPGSCLRQYAFQMCVSVFGPGETRAGIRHHVL